MKLAVNLLYVLSLVFIMGIVSLFSFGEGTVYSRIATGLVTGSFVAGVNTYISYRHQRKLFFKDLIDALEEIENELYRDYREVDLFISFFLPSTGSKVDMYTRDYFGPEWACNNKHYKLLRLRERIDARDYVPIIQIGATRVRELEDFEQDLSDFTRIDLWPINLFEYSRKLLSKGKVTDNSLNDFKAVCLNFKGRVAHNIVSFVLMCRASCFSILKKEAPRRLYEEFVSHSELLLELMKDEALINRFGGRDTYEELIEEWI